MLLKYVPESSEYFLDTTIVVPSESIVISVGSNLLFLQLYAF